MSQSQLAGSGPHCYRRPADGPRVVDDEGTIQEILRLLDDSDCRTILEATDGEALSAPEITDACGVPSSTLYRKLDRLTEAGLLEEGLRIRSDGKHTQEYSRNVDDVVLTVGDEGTIELEIVETEEPPSDER